jgi:putative Mg2+ transporter-C (MgtC) family protein
MIPESQIMIRLLVAAALGLIIGYERERKDHSAGLRTHMILVVGAALAMVLSINLAFWLGTDQPVGDPARLAAQVVSGIGFLGAGVIFRYGTNVRGLTTAASLWTVAMVGLVVGAGFYLTGLFATAILLISLTLLNYIEDRILPGYNRIHIILQATYRPGLVDEVIDMLHREKRDMGNLGMERDKAEGKITLDMQAKIWRNERVEGFVEELAGIQGVNHIKVTD